MSLAPERLSIGIRRHFTAPGVHPYDQVVWERRDAQIKNWKDGSVAFEQNIEKLLRGKFMVLLLVELN